MDFQIMMQMMTEKKISRAIKLEKLLYHTLLYRITLGCLFKNN